MQIIHALTPYHHEYGDLILGNEKYVSEYLESMLKGKGVFRLGYAGENTWNVLEKMGYENAKAVCAETSYECPYTDNKYYSIQPLCIITDDEQIQADKFISADGKYKPYWYDMACDRDWVMREVKHAPDKILKYFLGGIAKVSMGHGYTDFTLPSDGNGSILPAIMHGDNGSIILCATWVWHNK